MIVAPKPDASLDTECYRDFFLIKLKRMDTGARREFRMYPGHALNRAMVDATLKACRLFTFNGHKYDMVMIGAALQGFSNEALKRLSDELILTGLSPWHAERNYGFKIPQYDHIDLIEIMPGINSLKTYGGKMHSKTLQDLPIEPDASISPSERDDLSLYCGNDCDLTEDAARKFKAQIEIRERMSREYGIDLRSKSDAQIAEAVLKERISRIIGWKIGKPDIDIKSFKYTPPKWLSFKTPELQAIFKDVCDATFYVQHSGKVEIPKTIEGRKVTIGDSTYKLGIGGLHSTEKAVAHLADDDWILVDRDVASYYPAIIIKTLLFPQHLGRHFLSVYTDIFNTRIEAKRMGNKTLADTLKIVLNGSFGKFGNVYSALYSPDLMIQVTLTGQLALLMLIEQIESNDFIKVVSGNTDGIVIKCRKDAYDDLIDIIRWWEVDTGFETEETRYKALYSASVNSYIAIKEKGGVKLKGDFAEPEPVASSWPSPTNQVCVQAVCAYLEHGVDIELFIRMCRDIRHFVSVQRVTGGATWHGQFVGKTVRWIYTKQNPAPMYYRKANVHGTNNKVANSDGCRPLMTLPDEFPSDIDYERYIQIANDMLIAIGHTAPPPKVRKPRAKKATQTEFSWG